MPSNRLTLFIFVAIAGFIALIFINIAPKAMATSHPQLTAMGDLNGSAIFRNNIPYTLNFDQQETLVDFLNRSAKVKKSDYTPSPADFPYEKIIFYRFQGGNIEVFPVTVKAKNIVFNIPALSEDSYFLELSGGTIYSLLSEAYDH